MDERDYEGWFARQVLQFAERNLLDAVMTAYELRALPPELVGAAEQLEQARRMR